MKTNHERAEKAYRQAFNAIGSEYEDFVGAIERALDEAVSEAIEDAATRAMTLMKRLNTDYRHEIADAIRSRGDRK